MALIRIGGEDITASLSKRLLSMSITDNAGETADDLELAIDDTDQALEPPRKGVELSIAIGWADHSLVEAGRFTVDETAFQISPDQITVRAKSADMRDQLKSRRRRGFDDTTLGAIIDQIAGENGLDAACAPALAKVSIAHVDQANESDLHFLTRLGRDHGAVAAIKSGRLIFAPPGTGQTVSGDTLPIVTLTRGDLTEARGQLPDRGQFGKVRAAWRDRAAAQTRYAEAGDGEPVTTLGRSYADEASAQRAADAELDRRSADAGEAEVSLAGHAEIWAETPIKLEGVLAGLDGRWIAKTVRHQIDFSSSGFTTSVTLVKRLEENEA